KFLRRHRGKAVAVALVLLALLVGIVGTTWGLIEARGQEQEARRQEEIAHAAAAEKDRARAAAEQRKGEAERSAAEAKRRLAQVEKANELLGSIFDELDPVEVTKAERPLRALLVDQLDRAVAQLDGEAVGDALAVTKLQNRFGRSLLSLGAPAKG